MVVSEKSLEEGEKTNFLMFVLSKNKKKQDAARDREGVWIGSGMNTDVGRSRFNLTRESGGKRRPLRFLELIPEGGTSLAQCTHTHTAVCFIIKHWDVKICIYILPFFFSRCS